MPTVNKVSCIVPAYNEEHYISATLSALRRLPEIHEIIVVDDGSKDATVRLAKKWADIVIPHPRNKGKGAAMYTGLNASSGDILLFVDGDLGLSAKNAAMLIDPLIQEQAHMTVAVLPPARRQGGFGLVKNLAAHGISRITGFTPRAPLSGQRGITRNAVNSITSWDCRFGIEVGMTIDVLLAGYHIRELEVPFSHRETGRDWRGWMHRGKQYWSVRKILKVKRRKTHGQFI